LPPLLLFGLSSMVQRWGLLPNSDRQIQLLSLHNVKLFDTFLTDVDLRQIRGKRSYEFLGHIRGEPMSKNYTNYELLLIKENPIYLAKTTFFKGGNEVASPF
jgi:hypothetical protein